eukprot:TRINITY_DN9392_c0_g1_i1.p1 TRINITY_DN9392_c0_g1~~TRINITY_DN9392_c0_g1_i1.p1  ORF type:complete len:117 (-),score=8.62 TRINITY_DN9392_c0_g1_i1:943-1293(-)
MRPSSPRICRASSWHDCTTASNVLRACMHQQIRLTMARESSDILPYITHAPKSAEMDHATISAFATGIVADEDQAIHYMMELLSSITNEPIQRDASALSDDSARVRCLMHAFIQFR